MSDWRNDLEAVRYVIGPGGANPAALARIRSHLEAAERVVEAANLCVPRCDSFHHTKADRHEIGVLCPVALRFHAALAAWDEAGRGT